MYIEEIKRGLRGEIKKRENEQYCTCETNIRQMCKDVLAKIEEQESVIADKDKELRHHKYKRCLAMAMRCDEVMMSCELRGYAAHRIWYNRHQWAMRWKYHWLAIAEKFKEAK